MAMFLRSSFNKPIAVTRQGMASGTNVSFFTIPWNKLGYLKRIEVGRGCNGASGCIELNIYDSYHDDLTDVCGIEKRKAITIPPGTVYMNHDETEDIPLIGTISAQSSVSGIDVTIAARTL